MAGTWVRIGTVRSINPARRELRVDPARVVGSVAEGVERVRVAMGNGETMLCKVERASANPGGLIVTLGAGVPRDAVARMKGAAIEAERQRPKAPVTEQMDAADWIGLDIVGVAGNRIGVITGCIESPAHDILEIEMPDGQEVLLPAIVQTVESIDLDARCVTVGDIEPYVIRDAD